MLKKILIAVIINIIVISVTLGVVSYITVHESINQALENRVALTKIIAKYVDISLDNSINRLYEIPYSNNSNSRKNNAESLQVQKNSRNRL